MLISLNKFFCYIQRTFCISFNHFSSSFSSLFSGAENCLHLPSHSIADFHSVFVTSCACENFFLIFKVSFSQFILRHHVLITRFRHNLKFPPESLRRPKRIEYLVDLLGRLRTRSLISTAVALDPHDCDPHNRRPPGRWAPSTARRYARVRQRCDRTDLVPAASLKRKLANTARRPTNRR